MDRIHRKEGERERILKFFKKLCFVSKRPVKHVLIFMFAVPCRLFYVTRVHYYHGIIAKKKKKKTYLLDRIPFWVTVSTPHYNGLFYFILLANMLLLNKKKNYKNFHPFVSFAVWNKSYRYFAKTGRRRKRQIAIDCLVILSTGDNNWYWNG